MTDQFDPGKPCHTKGRCEVRIYATDGTAPYSIHGAYLDLSWGGWVPCSWDYLGRAVDHKDRHCDLVNVTPDVVLYQPVFTEMGAGAHFKNHEDAVKDGRASVFCGKFIAVLKITIRDGRDVSVEVEHV